MLRHRDAIIGDQRCRGQRVTTDERGYVSGIQHLDRALRNRGLIIVTSSENNLRRKIIRSTQDVETRKSHPND